MRQLALDFGPAPAPSFASFLPGRNRAALAAVRALAAAHPPQQRFIYLWGPPGSGRSHLLRALAAALGPRRARVVHGAEAGEADLRARCVQADDIPTHRRPHQSTAADVAAEAIAGAGTETDAPGTAWLIDDIDRLGPEAQEAAFHLFNRIQAAPGSAWLATGSVPPRALALREDLRTRVGSALVFELHPLDDADKAQALADAFAARGVSVGRDVPDFLLARLPRDLGTLAAAVEALDRLSLERKRAITIPLLRELMQQPGALREHEAQNR